jgi:hypothetical protein
VLLAGTGRDRHSQARTAYPTDEDAENDATFRAETRDKLVAALIATPAFQKLTPRCCKRPINARLEAKIGSPKLRIASWLGLPRGCSWSNSKICSARWSR